MISATLSGRNNVAVAQEVQDEHARGRRGLRHQRRQAEADQQRKQRRVDAKHDGRDRGIGRKRDQVRPAGLEDPQSLQQVVEDAGDDKADRRGCPRRTGFGQQKRLEDEQMDTQRRTADHHVAQEGRHLRLSGM